MPYDATDYPRTETDELNELVLTAADLLERPNGWCQGVLYSSPRGELPAFCSVGALFRVTGEDASTLNSRAGRGGRRAPSTRPLRHASASASLLGTTTRPAPRSRSSPSFEVLPGRGPPMPFDAADYFPPTRALDEVDRVIQRAAQRLARPHGWWQGSLTGPGTQGYPAYCAVGACRVDASWARADEAVRRLHAAALVLSGYGLIAWNDAPGRTQEQVVAFFRSVVEE